MSRRPKHPLRRGIERLGARVVAGSMFLLARMLPLPWVRAFANVAAYAFYVVTIRRQRLADRNLQAVFGDRYSAAERRRIRMEMSRNFCKVYVELFKFSTYSTERIREAIPYEGFENVQAAVRHGKGGIAFSAHFGNWELAGARAAAEGVDIAVVANQASDEGVTSIIDRAREACGMKVIYRDDLRGMLRHLRGNGVLAILPDQHQRDNAIQLDFLGLPAWSPQGPGILALRTGCPMAPTFGIRQPDDSITVVIRPPVPTSDSEDRDEAVAETMQRINDAISDLVREHPEQWLWLHDRWKERRPYEEGEQHDDQA